MGAQLGCIREPRANPWGDSDSDVEPAEVLRRGTRFSKGSIDKAHQVPPSSTMGVDGKQWARQPDEPGELPMTFCISICSNRSAATRQRQVRPVVPRLNLKKVRREVDSWDN
eukprot:TRINITY_DN73001_c0_g1_i1.p1 TRINITY_DN73001_c0_g1~~TRINITY_DN73001_c0_g1_i1.p1  ORF type:complete len:112 (-),score=10.35 TRINITY_DN73001_c0_g1_i1:36-371(-)